jgi:hypothetical protein
MRFLKVENEKSEMDCLAPFLRTWMDDYPADKEAKKNSAAPGRQEMSESSVISRDPALLLEATELPGRWT